MSRGINKVGKPKTADENGRSQASQTRHAEAAFPQTQERLTATNSQHKEIRALISVMAPKRAVSYIKSFGLPTDEENCLIECDVRDLSCIQAAQSLSMSPEQIKRARQRAFRKIADACRDEKSLG